MAVSEQARSTKKTDKSDKTKKTDNFFKDFVSRLTDEHLRFLDMRLKHRLTGDLAEAVNFLSTHSDMDKHLSAARGADEFYDMLDMLQKSIEREVRRRHS